MGHKPTDLRPIMTRLPEGLRRQLERAARASDNLMNAEIIGRLERSFEPQPLDLFKLIAKAAQKEKQKNTDFPALPVAEILADILEQIFPTLTSVKLSFANGEDEMISSFETFTEKGAKLDKTD